jgi:hypothetical protein
MIVSVPGRLALWCTGIVLLLAASGVIAFRHFVPNDQELAARLAAAAEQDLGVRVTVRAAHLQLWPDPQLIIEDAATLQPQPISLHRLVAKPRMSDLWHRRLTIEHVQVTGAQVPQLSLRELRLQTAGASSAPVEQIQFEDFTWITRYGKTWEFRGSVLFGAGSQLKRLELVREGALIPVDFMLIQDEPGHWQVRWRLGGGTADGELAIHQDARGRLQLSGELEPREVEVASALEAFKARPAVSGKASGRTQVSAQGNDLRELVQSLHTSTTFTMTPAKLLHIDMDRAIRTLGKEHAGQTPLRFLKGRMDTQNGPEGMVVHFSGLQTQGNSFSATGEGQIAKRRVHGEGSVDVAGGLVGMPLKIEGPVSQTHVSLEMTAVAGTAAGAALGTAVLPGIGTILGARAGGSIAKLFAPKKSAPAASR